MLARVRPGLMNAPLWFTAVRIVAIPPLMVLLLVDDIPGGALVGLRRLRGACLTDSIDGWLARSRGIVTVAGAFLDPLADKLLISAVLVSLVETGEVAAWAAMVIIAREFAVTGLRLVAAAEDVIISAGRFGKAKAFSQNVALAVIIVPGHRVGRRRGHPARHRPRADGAERRPLLPRRPLAPLLAATAAKANPER